MTTIGAVLTLFVLSFVFWPDNPAFRLAQHIFIGFSAAHFAVVTFHTTLKPGVLQPLFHGKVAALVPLLLGLCYLSRFITKFEWFSRYPVALTLGVGTGIIVRSTIQGTLFPQMKSLIVDVRGINNLIIVVGALLVLSYFIFTVPDSRVLRQSSRLARYVMMVYFGAIFGNTVMARVSLLLGRIQFLLGDWLHLIKTF